MSVTYIPVALRRLVEERANQRCEYCQLPAGVVFFPHKVDHVIKELISDLLILRQGRFISFSTPETSYGQNILPLSKQQ